MESLKNDIIYKVWFSKRVEMKKPKSKNTKMKLDLLQRMLNENVKQLNKWWQVRSQLQKRSIKKMGENDNQYFYTRK